MLHFSSVVAANASARRQNCSKFLQALLALANAEDSTRLGHVAQLAGYADQAHMTREVSEFAGAPPSTILGRVASALASSDLLSGAGSGRRGNRAPSGLATTVTR